MKKNQSFSKLYELFSGKWYLIILIFIFAVVNSISSVLTTLFIGKSIDNIIGENNVNFDILINLIFVLAFLFIIIAVFQWFTSILANKLAYQTVTDLRIKLFKKLNRLPISYFDSHPHGDILSNFTNDLNNVSDALSLTVVNLFNGLLTVISSLIIMFNLNVFITMIILFITPFCFFAAFLITKFSQKTFKKQQSVIGDLTSYVSEIIGNEKVVKTFGYEKRSIEKFKKINEELYFVGKKAHFASAIFNPLTRFLDHLSYMLVGVIGGSIAIFFGVSTGTISSFLIYSSQFSKPFNEFSSILGNIQAAFASIDRIFAVFDEIDEIEDSKNSKNLEKINGEIEFKNVDFSYNIEKPLIEDLNIHAKPGSLVAIVGPTGAGKTTIINLLMRFYEINDGAVFIDGENIKNIKRENLRKSFGMVLQETWLFNGTIRENIMYGNLDISEDEMVIASKNAQAHSFIVNLQNGYDTIIAKDGDNLSQGQKQLITIARVMLTNPSMLILDEATSSIDTLTEIRVQKAFRKLMEGRTSFVIAHRLSTIVSADIILVLNKGKIVEMGTHKQLLESNGFYSELYNSQFG